MVVRQAVAERNRLFFDYPSLWDEVWDRLLPDRTKLHLTIKVGRASIEELGQRLRWVRNGRAYIVDPSSQYAGLRGRCIETAAAIDSGFLPLASISPVGVVSDIHLRDVFRKIDPDDVDHLLLTIQTDWHKVPLADSDESVLGAFAFREVDIYIYKKPKKMSWRELCEAFDAKQKQGAEAYLHPPEPIDLEGIEAALRSGATLHAFRSGGGLRVVCIERKKQLIGYGEHYDVIVALQHADEDVLAGHRPYAAQYGAKGLYTHYLTGSSMAASSLDDWVLRGYTIDAYATRSRKNFVVVLGGYGHSEVPESLIPDIKAGHVVSWTERGFTYESVPSNSGVSYRCIGHDPDVDPQDAFMFHTEQRAIGPTLFEALLAALEADPVPVPRKRP